MMNASERAFKLRVIVEELKLIQGSVRDPGTKEVLELIEKYLLELADDTDR
jgi:hypothetical protein